MWPTVLNIVSVCLLLAGGLLMSVGIRILRTPQEVWERGRQATILSRKFNRNSLTQEEQGKFAHLEQEGVITVRLAGVNAQNELVHRAFLSEYAVNCVLDA